MCVTNLLQPVLPTGSKKTVPCVFMSMYPYKRSLAIRRKSRAPCPVSRFLSVPLQPACTEQERSNDTNKKNKFITCDTYYQLLWPCHLMWMHQWQCLTHCWSPMCPWKLQSDWLTQRGFPIMASRSTMQRMGLFSKTNWWIFVKYVKLLLKAWWI